MVFPSNFDDCDQVTVSYESFRKVCPQCNTVVHAMEINRSMRLRKVCPQCNTVVHVKRSVCDCGHAFASKKRKARCTAVGESENAMKRRKALLYEEELLVTKQRDKVRSQVHMPLIQVKYFNL